MRYCTALCSVIVSSDLRESPMTNVTVFKLIARGNLEPLKELMYGTHESTIRTAAAYATSSIANELIALGVASTQATTFAEVMRIFLLAENSYQDEARKLLIGCGFSLSSTHRILDELRADSRTDNIGLSATTTPRPDTPPSKPLDDGRATEEALLREIPTLVREVRRQFDWQMDQRPKKPRIMSLIREAIRLEPSEAPIRNTFARFAAASVGACLPLAVGIPLLLFVGTSETYGAFAAWISTIAISVDIAIAIALIYCTFTLILASVIGFIVSASAPDRITLAGMMIYGFKFIVSLMIHLAAYLIIIKAAVVLLGVRRFG